MYLHIGMYVHMYVQPNLLSSFPILDVVKLLLLFNQYNVYIMYSHNLEVLMVFVA
jgi:hypothetical protein